jgi:RNA polymerase sigma-70 factor (ECF subfamily)
MDARERDLLEAEIRRRTTAEDFAGAADVALRGYGREIYELLAALHRRDDDAGEVFSLFAEGMWRGLPSFNWRSSFRTWAYAVAHKASLRFRRDARRRAARLRKRFQLVKERLYEMGRQAGLVEPPSS